MFTGIITAQGLLAHVERRPGADLVWEVEGPWEAGGIAIGASIAHGGICLTVLAREPVAAGARWRVQLSGETRAITTADRYEPGMRINLERALRAGDELGGHIVSGHVDAVAQVVSVTPEGESHRLVFEVPDSLVPLIAPKGSVTVEGVSLTVNEVEGTRFGVNIIPHTWQVTTLGALKPGDPVNLEVDPLARHVARILDGMRGRI